MKATIESYRGPNTVITTGGDVVRLPVNVPHPLAGADVEVKKEWITGKATKAEVATSHASSAADEVEAARVAKAAKDAADAKEAELKRLNARK